MTQSGHFSCACGISPFESNFRRIGRQGGVVSSSKVSEPLSQWELMQEDTERKRLRKMDDAFCASLTAAIKRGEEKERSAN
jgi:hypothetical protein